MSVVISGTGIYTPEQRISNKELVESYNLYADSYNKEHSKAIVEGTLEALTHSDEDFIKKVVYPYLTDRNLANPGPEPSRIPGGGPTIIFFFTTKPIRLSRFLKRWHQKMILSQPQKKKGRRPALERGRIP